ncbi:hypothetical protein [Pseudoxanthomonas jiangsuensis]|uniref:hypothetical protein n=1 Tax=Pseudoxanthomonas jiangsuensis TaxID=619688 RepID=UPI001391466A|nr:hypothetical protein [Pseudoxanthomonas jiangsuensis]
MITPPDRKGTGEDDSDRYTAMKADRVERYREGIRSGQLTLDMINPAKPLPTH